MKSHIVPSQQHVVYYYIYTYAMEVRIGIIIPGLKNDEQIPKSSSTDFRDSRA